MKFSIKSVSAISLILLTSSIFAQAPPPFPPQINPYFQGAYTQPQGTAPYNAPNYASPYQQLPPQMYRMPPSQAPQAQQTPVAPYASPNQAPLKPFREFSGYLGLSLDIIPPSVRAQLPDTIKQGIVVKQFAPDSPAVTSDLKAFDVIYAYGKTAINHPAQFIKLVRDDEPGRSIKLKVVRKGKTLEIPVTLGSQKTPDPKEFNGLAIKQLGKDNYEALIRFVAPNGNKQMRSYKGTREEIFEQAMNAQDLPQAEREQLLFATRPRQGDSNNSGFGSFFPFGGKNESGKDWMNPSRFFKW